MRSENVLEHTGETAGLRPERQNLEMPAHLGGGRLEPARFARADDLAVDLDARQIAVRHHFAHPPAHDGAGGQPRHPFERGIDRQVPVIHRLSGRVEDHLVQREAVEHAFEERLITLLALAQRQLRLFARGDVNRDGQQPFLSAEDQGLTVDQGVDLAAVLCMEGQLQPGNAALFPERLDEARPIFGGYPADLGRAPADHVRPLKARHLQGILVDLKEGAVRRIGDAD